MKGGPPNRIGIGKQTHAMRLVFHSPIPLIRYNDAFILWSVSKKMFYLKMCSLL